MLKSWRPFLLGLCVGLLAAAIILILNRRVTEVPIKILPPPPAPTPPPLRVHVSGAVRAAGVYELPAGSIVQDALRAAGGPAESASTESLNLAAPLSDGQRVVVPEAARAAAAGEAVATPAAARQPPGLININTASQAELESLPRIGPALAQRIIEYRTAHGPFATIEDIKKVQGIGDSIFATIKESITVR